MNRLLLGDCLTVLPTLADRSVDLVLTEPPYLVNYQDRTGRWVINDGNDEWLMPAFRQIHRVLRNNTLCIYFYGWNRVDRFFQAWRAAGFQPVGHLVFAKSYASRTRFLSYHHESAYPLAKGRPALPVKMLPDVLPWKYSGNRWHPTQKPVECLTALIETFCPARGVVLDPFAGSGSTCIAARKVGRRFIGIELDATHHAAGSARLQNRAMAGEAA